MSTASRLVTAMRYRDVAAAVEWLCSAFGFEKQTVALSDTGTVLYAQLTYGNAMLMLAPVRDTSVDQFMKQPDEIGGAETQSCYFVVGDIDAHHARATAAGAQVVLDLDEDGSGGRGYSCRDPEGHIWSFGTHDPWPGARRQPGAPDVPQAGRGWRIAAGLAVVLAVAVVAAWVGGTLKQTSAVSSTARQFEEQSADADQLKEAAERALREVREELERERIAKAAAERASQEALKRIAEEQRGKDATDKSVQQVREDLERERLAKAAAERASQEAQARAAEERRAKSVAEKAVEEARDQLARERAAKVAAERAGQEALKQIAAEKAAREAAERTAKAALEQAGKDPEGRLTEVRNAKEAAEHALAQVRAQLAEAEKAREAAERAASEARAQVAREQTAKNAAWKANAQLRRQMSQQQQSGSSGEAAPPTLTIGPDNTVVPSPAPSPKVKAGPDE
jgi:uncharacterized glyoxalase superfamily protein PhnB